MKKNKHIIDLKEEKMRLRIRQLELEKELHLSWQDLKETMQPGALLKNKLADISGKKINDDNLLGSILSYGAAYLTCQFVAEAGEKIETRVQTGIENLANKIKTVFRRKR